jgi:lipopolysaccharide transport system permease protein
VLLLPVVVALLGIFTLGVALMMAASTAVFRDVRHLLDIAMQVLFWATPILYTPSSFPPPVAALAILSPLAPFITACRDMIYAGVVPAPHVWVLALIYSSVSLTLGLAVFASLEERFAESV